MRTDRLEFDKATKEAAWLRADERCEHCGVRFGGRRPEYDHRVPAALGGDNSLANCFCICVPCHRLLTKLEDRPRITKAKRTEETRAGLRKKSRGFNNKWKPNAARELDPDT